ncbi:MAG: hypothetical protein CSYNP_01141 [Syntrophus sp. SKADARSKE-3]|nr:hypothetical protein [Syntrophus sp. SKADARSKE-3]
MGDRRLEDDRSGNISKKRRRIHNYESRKSTFRWIGIIIIVGIIVMLMINFIPPLFEKFDIVDTTYRPRDVERQYNQIQNLRESEPDKTRKDAVPRQFQVTK